MGHLKVIEGTPPPDTPRQRVTDRIKKMPKPGAVLQCPRCAGQEVLTLLAGAMSRNGKVVGGTKITVCANCHRNGERVVLA